MKTCTNCRSWAINEHLHNRVRGHNSHLCDTCYWEEETKQAQEKLEAIRSLGVVYVPPNSWNSAKSGGPPSIEDYEEIDLTTYEP